MILTYTLAAEAPTTAAAPDDAISQLFGQDLLFENDLQLDAGGDYILLDGKDALRQAIYHRLLVVPGEYALRPDYGAGLSQYVKKRINRAELDQIRQRVIDQLSRDDRIERVIECTTEVYTIGDRPGLKVYVKILCAGQEMRFPMTFQERN